MLEGYEYPATREEWEAQRGGIRDKLIESMGACIVADQLCWGSKSFADLADEEIDPIDAIARRMLEHMPCPRMLDQYPKRLANLLEAVKQYRVDGIICQRLRFCDLWGGETEMLQRSLKEEAGIPLLVLERDYAAASGVGQLRTRVQAFLETLA